MATPDIQHLFERFLQIYGGQSSSTEPPRSEPRYQSLQSAYSAPADAYGSDEGYAPSGGVLRGWNSLSPAAPSWARVLMGPGGMPLGLRGPPLGGRIGGGLPLGPMPSGSGVFKTPNPHLERFIPQSTRDFWNAVALGQQMFRGRLLGDDPGGGSSEGENGASSTEPLGEPQTNRPGSQPPWYVGPPVFDEERKRQSMSNESEGRPAQEFDPDFRKLERVERAKDYALQALPEAAAGRVPRVKSPRLVPEQEVPESDFGKDVSSDGGNCGNGRDGDGREPDKNAYCDARQDIEIERCDVRSQKRPRWPNFIACVERAKTRGNQCRSNGGMPPLFEREEWGIDDEHQINSDRRFMLRRERPGNSTKSGRKKT